MCGIFGYVGDREAAPILLKGLKRLEYRGYDSAGMGFPWTLGKAFFIIPRTVGITAHVHEELTQEKPVRRLDNTVYTGKKRRSL